MSQGTVLGQMSQATQPVQTTLYNQTVFHNAAVKAEKTVRTKMARSALFVTMKRKTHVCSVLKAYPVVDNSAVASIHRSG